MVSFDMYLSAQKYEIIHAMTAKKKMVLMLLF